MIELDKTRIELSAKDEVGPVSKIVEMLNNSFDIISDEIDPSKVYITRKDGTNYITFEEISLFLIEKNISKSDTLLRKILRCPSYFKSVNLVKNYLDNLKGKYKGESQIDVLCKHLKAADFGDQKKGYYQKRMINLIRKWIVSSVACSLGAEPNQVALGFIHQREGIGKSHLVKFLCPKTLYGFYEDVTTDTKKINLEELFAKRFIVNFDELVGINQRNPEDFKQAMTKSDCLISLPGNPFQKLVPRVANALFTSNRVEGIGGFITPRMGYRRFGCIELENIDKSYSKLVDTDQLWAEGVSLYLGGYEYLFSDPDFDEFEKYNKRYFIKSLATKIIQLGYEVPSPDVSGEWMSATEILHDIMKRKIAVHGDIRELSTEKIGEALHNLGYKRESKWVPELNQARAKYFILKINI